jgi:short-subunit dehydrogenase
MGLTKTLKRKISKVSDFFSKKNTISKNNIIITGANSGIGFELVKNLNQNDNNILAFVNNDEQNLKSLTSKKITIVKCDFSNLENFTDKTSFIKSFEPNIIINCAAIFGSKNQSYNDLNILEYNKIININVLAPFLIIQNALTCVSLNQIINISSQMGSITMNTDGNYYLYRCSKSLLNSLSKNLSIDLMTKGINVFCVHPGDVKSKMNSAGTYTAESSSQKIINIISENNSSYNGKFINIDKEILQW